MTAVATFHPMTAEPDEPEKTTGARLRRLAIDLGPLRTSRDFRLIWTGLLVTSTGSQFTLVAVFVQVKELTDSEAAVGATGLAYLLGLVVGSLAGGAILDAWDRRRLLMFAQVGLAAGSAILLGGAIAGEPPLWLIYAGLAVLAASSSLDGPTRSAITARVLGPAQLPAAQALNQVVWNTAGLLGPLLAGLVIAAADGNVTVAYAIDLASIGCMFIAAWLLKPMPPMREDHADTGLQAIREGFDFARKHRLIMSTFLIDLIAMIFGLPRVLFPFLIVDKFHGSAKSIGRCLARSPHERLDGQDPPPGTGGDRVRGSMGHRDRGVRVVDVALAGPRDAGARRLGGRDQRDLPDDDPADDGSGSPAGTALRDPYPRRDRRTTTRRCRGGRGRSSRVPDVQCRLGRDRVRDRRGTRRARLPGAPPGSRRGGSLT
jgi:hypothetical protein